MPLSINQRRALLIQQANWYSNFLQEAPKDHPRYGVNQQVHEDLMNQLRGLPYPYHYPN